MVSTRQYQAGRVKRIRVFLVPSQTYQGSSYGCDLRIVRDRLNESQSCYEFVTLSETKRERRLGSPYRTGAPIKRSVPLTKVIAKPNGLKSLEERRAAVNTYLEYQDAFQQYVDFTSNCEIETIRSTLWDILHSISDTVSGRRHSSSDAPFGRDDLIVGIGSEVAVPDIPTEAEGTAELDAYSSLSYWGDDYDGPDNNVYNPLNQVGLISLRRLSLVFPEVSLTDQPGRARAIVARYIIMNIAGLLASRTFSTWVNHDDASGCLNETAWIGAERESYYVGGFCDQCLDRYEELPVADSFSQWTAQQIVSAVEKIVQVPNKIDKGLATISRSSYYQEIAVVTIATGIVSNVLLDITLRRWDVDSDYRLVHYKSHNLALIVALLAISAACGLYYRARRSSRKLP